MNDRKSLASAIAAEERRIQEALRAIGYFAYKIRFIPCGEAAPTITLEAREWGDSDNQLLASVPV